MVFENVERDEYSFQGIKWAVESIDMIMLIAMCSLRTTSTSEDRLAMKVSMSRSVFAGSKYDGRFGVAMPLDS